MGVKPGYGPVIKVMRDAADHPWTTPNTDWDKFIVNSEVQEIAYGHVGISHTFVPADYSFPTGAFPDVRYWPNEANWIWRSDARTSGGSAYLFFHFNLENIPDTILNAFHFLIRDASDWVSLWTRRTYRYNANDWYHQFSRKYWFTPRQQDVDYGLGILYDSDTGTWSQWEFLVSLWPTGVVGNDNSETSGPNSQSYYTTREFKFSYYRLDLPMDGSAYPAVVGTPSPGKKILRCSPSGFRMAKPGFDLDSATTEQLLFSDENVPLKIIRTGTVTLAPLATAQVDLGAVYPSSILVDFRDELEASATILARVPDDAEIGLVVDLARLGIDLDGDGRIELRTESAAAIVAAISGGGRGRPQDMPDLTFRFDRADGYWLQGYANFLMAQADFWLAHDFQNAFDGSFHMFFPRAGLPLQEALVPRGRGDGSLLSSEWRIADLISLIHYVNWPVVEPERRRAARHHLLEMIRLSRENWRAILAETDNDREWLPGPHQPGVHVLTGLEVGDEEVEGWMQALDMAEDLLEGRTLMPHFRIARQGIDVKRFFEEPTNFDLVPMVTGPGVVPYLSRGRILTAEEFDDVRFQFGGAGFLAFAVWFN